MELTLWDRVPDGRREALEELYSRDVALTVSKVALVPPDPDYPDIEWQKDGVTYRSNLPVSKHLKASWHDGDTSGDVRLPVGEKDGRLYLLAPAPVEHQAPR